MKRIYTKWIVALIWIAILSLSNFSFFNSLNENEFVGRQPPLGTTLVISSFVEVLQPFYVGFWAFLNIVIYLCGVIFLLKKGFKIPILLVVGLFICIGSFFISYRIYKSDSPPLGQRIIVAIQKNDPDLLRKYIDELNKIVIPGFESEPGKQICDFKQMADSIINYSIKIRFGSSICKLYSFWWFMAAFSSMTGSDSKSSCFLGPFFPKLIFIIEQSGEVCSEPRVIDPADERNFISINCENLRPYGNKLFPCKKLSTEGNKQGP